MSELKAAPHLDLRIATYNIHRCRGMDRRTAPQRIAEVLREIDADVVALQEVIGAGPAGAGQAEEIGAALGMGWVMTSVRHLRRHLFGNVILSRYPIAHHSQYDLSWKTCEPRACQRADLDLGPGRVLHVYNVHLGTAVLERRYQAPRLASYVHDHRIRGPKIILGDFNEWMRGLATKTLSLAVREHRHPVAPQTPPHLSGHLPDGAPRPHLLRGRCGSALGGAAPQPQGADGVRPPAARRQSADRVQVGSAFRRRHPWEPAPEPATTSSRIDESDVKVISL